MNIKRTKQYCLCCWTFEVFHSTDGNMIVASRIANRMRLMFQPNEPSRTYRHKTKKKPLKCTSRSISLSLFSLLFFLMFWWLLVCCLPFGCFLLDAIRFLMIALRIQCTPLPLCCVFEFDFESKNRKLRERRLGSVFCESTTTDLDMHAYMCRRLLLRCDYVLIFPFCIYICAVY